MRPETPEDWAALAWVEARRAELLVELQAEAARRTPSARETLAEAIKRKNARVTEERPRAGRDEDA